MKKISKYLSPLLCAFVVCAVSPTVVLGLGWLNPPDDPFEPCDENHPEWPDCLDDPPALPEPTAISLIGMGVSAAAGLYLRRKKRQ